MPIKITTKSLDRYIYETFSQTDFRIRDWVSEYNPIEGELYWRNVDKKLKVQATPFCDGDDEMPVMHYDIGNHQVNYIRTVQLKKWVKALTNGEKSMSHFMTYYMNLMSKLLTDEYLEIAYDY